MNGWLVEAGRRSSSDELQMAMEAGGGTMTWRKRKWLVQVDAPAPRMTVAAFKQWERRQILAFPAWPMLDVWPGDEVNLTLLGDGSVHTILIVEGGEVAAGGDRVIASTQGIPADL